MSDLPYGATGKRKEIRRAARAAEREARQS
jgi:hypothetical protein